jgi:hypothetical protein
MHGSVEKNLDDNLPFQIMAYFFLLMFQGEFFKKTNILDP